MEYQNIVKIIQDSFVGILLIPQTSNMVSDTKEKPESSPNISEIFTNSGSPL